MYVPFQTPFRALHGKPRRPNNRRYRMMSDYEVTLINDNSRLPSVPPLEKRRMLPYSRILANSIQCTWPKNAGSAAATQLTSYLCRQEFYVAFKGPTESKTLIPASTTHQFMNRHQLCCHITPTEDTHADSGFSVSAVRRWSMESPR